MKIVFYENNLNLKYNPNTAKNTGIGSSASCLIELSREFAKKGHDVTCYVHCNRPDLYDNVKFYDITNYVDSPVDLFIGLESFPRHINSKFVVNWVQRNTLSPQWTSNFDKIILTSEWQKNIFSRYSNIAEKIEVIENGIDLELFNQPDIKKQDYSIIHSAFPTKGATYLKDIFRRIKEELPQTLLHVYTGGKLWGWEDDQFRPMYNQMIREKILFHGQIGRETLARRLNEMKIFLHPCVFAEPFGQTILEAMAAGCVVITIPVGNLPNLIKNNETGFLIEGKPSDFVWQHAAKDKVVELLKDNDKFERMSKAAREFASKFTWKKAVDKWESLL